MGEDRDDIDAAGGEPDSSAEETPRVRFKGIVEAGASDAASPAPEGNAEIASLIYKERYWNSISRQVSLASRLTAIFVFFAFVAGLPVGNLWAHVETFGSLEGWSLFDGYRTDFLIFAIIIPVLIVFIGYLFSRLLMMLNAAESIAAAAHRFVTPDITAVQNADTVGAVVQGHLTTLNEGLDGALARLATVEAMIRQHVEAIEVAGEAIEHKATGAVSRVADERARLMELTESLNAHADSFAAAIAEKAKSSIESLESASTVTRHAEQEFDARLQRLETAAANALSSFEALREALRGTDETMRASAASINEAAARTMEATGRIDASAEAAAEAAARSVAKVSASAQEASEAAKKTAQAAIDAAQQEAARISGAAVEATAQEAAKMQEATKQAIGAAAEDAAKATKAAAEVSEAARQTGDATAKASAEIAAASERARKDAGEATQQTKAQAGRIEEQTQALADARAALEKENARLEALIEEQRNRADRLADAIASQTDRLSRLAEAQLREQEAAARLTQAQSEMQSFADQQAATQKHTGPTQKKQSAAETKAAQLAEETIKEDAAGKDVEKQPALDLEQASRKNDPPAANGAPKKSPSENRPPAKVSASNANGGARLDELARDIAERRPGRGARNRKEPPVTQESGAEEVNRRRKGEVSWREILDAADDAEPLELGDAAKKAPVDARHAEENAIKTISRLQRFTYDLETRLYGDPPPALQERFDRGDRNVFANRLLRLNEADVKRRIRTESGRNKDFERGIHDYLQGFEKLLEDATTSETADEELEEYLSSPLGRVYLLIGATVGYFA